MSNWVDFTAIKHSVALAVVLRQYQVRLRRSGHHQYRGICPIHGGEGRDAFHANLSQNVFHCFSCGAGGSVLDFVAAMERCSVREAALRLQQERGETTQPGADSRRGKATVTEKMSTPAPLGFSLRGIDSTHPYLAERGIRQATAMEFGVGFYRGAGILSGRLAIPIHNARGELVAYAGRTLDRTEPRYRFPAGFGKSEILFNLHRAAATGQSTVVVVEGFFDCLKVHQAGTPAVVALMGAVLYPAQHRSLLEHFQRVILMLDGDDAGRCATVKIAAQLHPHASVGVVHLLGPVQPDQLSIEAIREVLAVHTERVSSAGSVK